MRRGPRLFRDAQSVRCRIWHPSRFGAPSPTCGATCMARALCSTKWRRDGGPSPNGSENTTAGGGAEPAGGRAADNPAELSQPLEICILKALEEGSGPTLSVGQRSDPRPRGFNRPSPAAGSAGSGIAHRARRLNRGRGRHPRARRYRIRSGAAKAAAPVATIRSRRRGRARGLGFPARRAEPASLPTGSGTSLTGPVRLAVLPPTNLTSRSALNSWLPLVQSLFTVELTGVHDLGVIDPLSLNLRLASGGDGTTDRQLSEVLKSFGVVLTVDSRIVPVNAGLQLQASLVDVRSAELRFTVKSELSGESDLPRAVKTATQAIVSYFELQVLKLADSPEMHPSMRFESTTSKRSRHSCRPTTICTVTNSRRSNRCCAARSRAIRIRRPPRLARRDRRQYQ